MKFNAIKWVDRGPDIDKNIVAQVEQRIGIRFPGALVWFWTEVANGGHPTPPPEIPLYGIEGHDLVDIDGIYGIASLPGYDLADALKIPGITRLLPRLLPIGFDPGGGRLFIVCDEPDYGQIRYMLLDDIWDESQVPEGYFVANNMQEFAEFFGVH
ncbi:MAG TPA: SMI1/KNR4 family protein [Fimbriimonadaceae bacterium]